MKEMKTDIFKIAKDREGICITTNGIVKKDGCAVMGAGVAKFAKEKYKGIDKRLGEKLKTSGNHVYALGTVQTKDGKYFVISFPTKNNWRDNSDIKLIEQSCKELIAVCEKYNLSKCYIPRPGCTNGHLNWEKDVKPVLEPILDDRFIIVYQ